MTTTPCLAAHQPHRQDTPPASLEDIIGCSTSIFWSLRTLRMGLSVFDHPYDVFAADVAADDEYAAELVEMHKAILLDQLYAERRRAMADRVLARIGAALAARKDPATDAALRAPIDVERLPKMSDIQAWKMNDVRPGLPWPYDF